MIGDLHIRKQQGLIMHDVFLRITRWQITPTGVAFFRVYGQPRERLCSLPVSVLFRVSSAEKTNMYDPGHISEQVLQSLLASPCMSNAVLQ